MSKKKSNLRGLLPNGLSDSLAPDAQFEARLISCMMGVFTSHGYDCIRPPIVEFEETLLDGPGGAIGGQMFRLMDPVSHRMMGVRPDITPQIARIASTRLKDSPRPLRLSYSGPVLTVTASELRPDREITQVGIELIGSDSLKADAEVITLTAEALKLTGLERLSFDLSMPQLVPLICKGLDLDEKSNMYVRDILNRKESGAVSAIKGLNRKTVELFEGLLHASGFANTSLKNIESLSLPPVATALVDNLRTVVNLVSSSAPDLQLTIDPVEFRGAQYQTGISFTIFAQDVRSELGRGGRYPLNGETATGSTLFVDALLNVLSPTPDENLLYLLPDVSAKDGERLRKEGWRTIKSLENDTTDIILEKKEASKLKCTHVFINGKVVPLKD